MLGCWPHLGARNARQKIKLNELYPNLLSSNNFRRIHIESSVLVKGVYRFFPRGPATPAGPRMKSCSPLSIMKSDLVLPHESLRMVVLQLYRVAVLVHPENARMHLANLAFRPRETVAHPCRQVCMRQESKNGARNIAHLK